jgi:hypothetical protein
MDRHIGDFSGIRHKDTALWETLVNKGAREILNITTYISENISWAEMALTNPICGGLRETHTTSG